MMVIPADLPASLTPLAWMLGTWRGWSMYFDFDEAGGFAVIEEITGVICGEQILLTTSIYHGVPKADAQIDPIWDAAAGLMNIARGDLIFEKSVYVSVLPGSGVPPKSGEYMPYEFIATSATMNVLGVLWAGAGVGPRVQMVSGTIACGVGAQETKHLERIYDLVAGELTWTQERTLIFSEVEVKMSGRFICVAQATTESDETVEGIDTEAEDELGR